MVVIKFATYTTRCPFSKILIKPTNKICLFTEKEFDAFKKIINDELQKFLPQELIDLIIEKTGYIKLIHSFGLINYTYWTTKRITPEKKFRNRNINRNKKNYIIESDETNQDWTDSDSDELENFNGLTETEVAQSNHYCRLLQ